MSDNKQAGGPLTGVKLVEWSGIGPAPLCCALLSDMAADIIRIDRNTDPGLGIGRPNATDVTRRGRASVSVDLKSPDGIETVMRLIDQAEAVIDPFRPGVTERLGLGPEDCFKRNKKLIYGRMTGWGQDGALSQAAGHDLNYLAVTGVLNAIGPKETPIPPLNVVADMGGGAMFLAVGILAGIINARTTGEGQVVDTAMTEGSAFLGMGMWGLAASDNWVNERASNVTDGGSHFYRCYKTKDDKFVSIASIEAKFYAILLDKLELNPAGLPPQMDRSSWPDMVNKFEALFAAKTRDEWCEIMEGTDICFAPVLDYVEAQSHPHNKDRNSYVEVGGVVQPGPAPKFSRTPSQVQCQPPLIGENTKEGLHSWGFGEDEVETLLAKGAVGWKG